MKVKLIKWSNVEKACNNDSQMKSAFRKFRKAITHCNWTKPNDIIKTFNSADIIKCSKLNRVVFNVGGNKFRMICSYLFTKNKVFLYLKFIGTHSAYDKLDACKVDMF